MSILSAGNGRVGRAVLGASRPGEVEDAVRDPARRPPEPRLRGVGLPAGRRVTDTVPEPHPRGSRFGDVTWARIVPGGLARIERRGISSRWACTARGGMDSVELIWHYASQARPAPAPAAPGLVREPARGRRGPDADPRPIPSRPGRPASTSPNPRARTPGRRARGLGDDLAGRVTISRVTRRSRGPDGVPLADPDSPDGEDGEAPTPGAWRCPSGRAWAESRRRSPSRCAQPYWLTAPPFTGA